MERLDEVTYGCCVAAGLAPADAWRLPMADVLGVRCAQRQAAAVGALLVSAAVFQPSVVSDCASWFGRKKTLAEKFGQEVAADVRKIKAAAWAKLKTMGDRWPGKQTELE